MQHSTAQSKYNTAQSTYSKVQHKSTAQCRVCAAQSIIQPSAEYRTRQDSTTQHQQDRATKSRQNRTTNRSKQCTTAHNSTAVNTVPHHRNITWSHTQYSNQNLGLSPKPCTSLCLLSIFGSVTMVCSLVIKILTSKARQVAPGV